MRFNTGTKDIFSQTQWFILLQWVYNIITQGTASFSFLNAEFPSF